MNDSTPITLSKFKSPYTIISHLIAREARLSFEARGLLIFLAGLPEDWTFYYKHIVMMSPSSMYKLRKTIAELRKIGAIDIKPNKLSKEKAKELTKLKNKEFKEGYFYGQKWSLIEAEKWAIEATLDWKAASMKESSGIADFGESENRKDGIPHTKKYKLNELSNISTTTTKNLVDSHKHENDDLPKLHFSKGFSKKERESIGIQLKDFKHKVKQQILDQFEYNFRNGQIKNKDALLAYIMGLIRKAQKNEFFFTAEIIAKEREQKIKVQDSEAQNQNTKFNFKYDDNKRSKMYKSIGIETKSSG